MTTATKPDSATQSPETGLNLPALIDSANRQLQDFNNKGAHFLCPLTITDIPKGCQPVVVYTTIDPDPKNKEVYSKWGGDDDDHQDGQRQVELSGVGLRKISNMLGISWPYEKCGRIDDGSNPNRCVYRMVSQRTDYTGQVVEFPGEYEIDLEVLTQEFTDKYTAKAGAFERWLTDDKKKSKVPYAFVLAKRENSVQQWIRDCVKRDILQKRKHMVALAQTGAMLRAIRSKGFRQTYTADELKKPFVDIRVERVKSQAEIAAEAERASEAMYGKSGVRKKEAVIHDVDDGVIDAKATTIPEHGEPGPTPEQSRRADFQAAEPGQQATILKTLIKQKGYAGKTTGDIAAWSSADRLAFYDQLVGMPDKTTDAGSRPPLPFEK